VLTNSTPPLFIGLFDDWRVGMETYARNLDEKPAPLPTHTASGELSNLTESPISGFNTWAYTVEKAGSGIQPNQTNMHAASDVLFNLSTKGFGGSNVQYITRDAVYNMNTTQTCCGADTWVQHIKSAHNPAQQAGSYDAPWAWYGAVPRVDWQPGDPGGQVNDAGARAGVDAGACANSRAGARADAHAGVACADAYADIASRCAVYSLVQLNLQDPECRLAVL